MSTAKMADACAGESFRWNADFNFTSYRARELRSAPETALKAERGQPVAAPGYLGREFKCIASLHKVKHDCGWLSKRLRRAGTECSKVNSGDGHAVGGHKCARYARMKT
jgi:hypothetical protein